MVEYVTLVNQKDEVIGEMEKMQAHELGLLHRRFQFLFSTVRMNCCFRNVVLLNTTAVVYGQTPVAVIHVRTKK